MVKSNGKPPNINYDYFCIRFKNLGNLANLGQITVKKDFNWNFAWNYDLKEKNIKLKSGNETFDQLFQTTCTNEIEAKNYLTNKKLEKLINLRQKLSLENTFFYLDNSTQKSDIYILFRIKNQWKVDKNFSVAENTVNQLNLVCEIFDNFYN